MKNLLPLILFFLFSLSEIKAQSVSLFEELHGHITFEWFGSSNNTEDNSASGFDCANDNQSFSSASITLPNGATVQKALLYWSGSGSGDFDVTLSGPSFSNLSIAADREFHETFALKNFFAGAYDITAQVSSAGSGVYTLSGLDASTGFAHCVFNTIYSGWSILVIYEEASLPFSTVRVYDGFEGLRDESNDYLIDNVLIESSTNTKFGILAWESDVFFSPEESIKINNAKISNSYNPANQIFNQTNYSNAGSTSYNMDLDVFDISSYVNINDTQIPIQLTIGGDLIFLNAFAISYQNKLPDASVIIDSVSTYCDQNLATIQFEVSNQNCNDILPQGTKISFYQNNTSGILLASAKTLADIPIGGSESQAIQYPTPGGIYDIIAIIDPTQEVLELDETNNMDTATLSLMQTPVFQSISETICFGDSINWQGQYYHNNIILTDTFITANGCDSIINWALTVHPKIQTTLDTTICSANLPYTLPDGSLINTSGTYTSILTAQSGCDSTIITTLSTEQSTWLIQEEICPGDSLFYDGQFFFSDTSFTSTQPATNGGCDSIITFSLSVKPLQIDTIFSVLCNGTPYELPDGTVVDTAGIFQTKINCNHLKISILTNDTSTYSLGLPDSLQIVLGESILLEAAPNFNFYNFNWTPTASMDCATCLATNTTPTTNTTYVLTGENKHGCTVSEQVYISIITPTNEAYIPNSFSPNGDGHNDEFLIYGTKIVRIKQLEIYDRWGSLLFSQKDLDTTKGWNGRYQGKIMNTGTYIYVMKVEFKNGDVQLFSGDITLWH